MATKRLNFRKKTHLKIISSDAIRGIKLNLCINIILTSTKSIFLLQLLMYFRCYANLKFPLIYNRKSKNWHLLLFHVRYFDKSSSEMFVEWSSSKHILFFSKPLNLIGCKGIQKSKFQKVIQNLLLKSYMGDKAETFQKYL